VKGAWVGSKGSQRDTPAGAVVLAWAPDKEKKQRDKALRAKTDCLSRKLKDDNLMAAEYTYRFLDRQLPKKLWYTLFEYTQKKGATGFDGDTEMCEVRVVDVMGPRKYSVTKH